MGSDASKNEKDRNAVTEFFSSEDIKKKKAELSLNLITYKIYNYMCHN